MNVNDDIVYQFISNNKSFQKKTLYDYSQQLTIFFNFVKMPYDQVSSRDIRLWLNSLYDADYKISTIVTKYNIVRSFYFYCIEENLIFKNPIEQVKKPVLKEKPPYYLTKEQLYKLRELVKCEIRDKAIVETLYSSGVRISELMNIQISDIEWDKREIKIMGKGQKERIVLFTYQCKTSLQEYLLNRKDENPYLFITKRGAKKMGTRHIQTLFQGYSKALGFYISPHTIRHTFAAHLAENGMPITCIQDLLGHEYMETTKIYSKLCVQAQKAIFDKFN